jgi:hypothetical protein
MKARRMLWAAMLLASPGLACAAVFVDQGNTDEIHQEVTQLKDAVNDIGNTSDAKVYTLAQDLFGRMPSTKIAVQSNLRGWDFPAAPESSSPASSKQLLESADKRLAFYNKEVPKPLAKAMDYARGMTRDGKVDYDKSGELSDNEMGEYKYWLDKAELGTIKLNKYLALIAAKVGSTFAFATVAHESGHARDQQDGKLNPKDVIQGEVMAFQTEDLRLTVADPYGEKIGYLRARLMIERRDHPNQIGAMTLLYLNHLADLQSTNGDEDAIRKMVEKLGYKDGEPHREGNSVSA